jgi:TonB family protein
VLASDEEGGTLDALKFSLATDIVELVVLTTDQTFLQTLREAVGGSRRLWHVPSSDKVSDLLVAGEVGILVVDVQTLNEPATVFVGQIKRQFPDLVVVVAGNRDAEISLAGLISAGIVYRFIHKPMSPGRAKLFADAAVKKYDEHRRRAAAPPPGRNPRFPRGALIGGTLGALGVIVVAAWALHRNSANDTAPANAAGAPGAPGVSGAAGETARAGLAEVRERLLARAETALLEERLDEASAAIETARKSGVEHGRIAFLSAQLAKSRGQVKAAQAAARASAEPKAGGDKVGPLLDLAAQRLGDARLIDPADDSALYYIRRALQLDPGSDAVQEAQMALAIRLLTEIHDAIDRRDFAHASSWLAAADGIAAAANIQAAQAALAAASAQTETEAHAQLPKNAADRTQQDRPIEPADDSAKASAPHDLDAADAEHHFLMNVIAAGDLTLVKSVNPTYPKKAEFSKIQGWVELDFTVAENGVVKDVVVHAASSPGVFDDAAISALSQWRYKPVLRDSKPAAQRTRIRIRFALAS